MRKQIIKFLFLLLAFGYATEAKSGEFTVDDIWYYYTNEDDDEVGVMYSKSGEYSGDVVIPSTVTYNGKQYTVTSIGSKAFSGCTRLKKVTIPNSVTSIGNEAFYYCIDLTTVTVPNSVTSIGNRAFENCTGLKTVTLGNSVTSIRFRSFYGCTGLTTVKIGNSVTTIGYKAFDGCTDLTTVIWNARNAQDFQYDSCPFSDCENLTEFVFGEEVEHIPAYLCYNLTLLNTIVIPNSVTSIGKGAFAYCIGLTTVTIPNSVTSIGSSAFAGCTGLTTVTIGNSVTSIGSSAFAGCTGLTTVTIGNSVTSIGGRAFENCTGLITVTIPNSVTSIENYAFPGCTSLKKVIWNARNAQDCQYGRCPFSYCKNLTEFVFGEEVEHIPGYLCNELTSLNTIVIPNSVTSIGSSAFAGCKGLTEVTIGNSVKSIGSWAFSSCTSLTAITIPNSVTSIESGTFFSCTGLTEVTIPNSVTSIGSRAFFSCTGLKKVTIGNSVKSIGNEAFPHCTSLTAITIPNSVTSIESGTFYSCTSLKTVTIGNSVKSIGSNAFSSCTSLTAITIPNSVTSIGDETFYNCRSLEHVTSKAMMPPQIWVTTFDDYAMTLYVPAGCKSKYAEAEYWNNFTDIRETGVVLYTVTANATDETMGYVTGGGEYPQGSTATLVAIPFGQNYFVRWNDGNTDNPRTITVTGDMTFTAEFAPAGSAVETLGNGERGIYATGRTLHVENGGESYRVYTAAGRLVYTGNDSSVTLSAPGMYIVRTGDRSQKVAVK